MPAIVGETKKLTWVEENCATEPTAATIYIVDPSDTVVTPAPDVAISSKPNDDDGIDVTLSASYLFATAGLYIVRWKPVIGAFLPYWQCPVVAFKTGDVVHEVRHLLNITDADVTDNVLDSNISRVFLQMQKTYIDEIPSYTALTTVEALAFDHAVALTVAASMRPAIAKNVPAGELVEMTIAGDKFKYTNPFFDPSRALDPIEKQWLDEAHEAMMTISAVSDAMTTATSSFFATAGKRQYARDYFGIGSTTPMYDMYSDIAMAWDWAAEYVTWSE